MKSNFAKTVFMLAGVCVLAACSSPKNDNKNSNNDITPLAVPEGHYGGYGTDSQNKFCDIADGKITCSNRDPNTQALCTISRTFNNQDLQGFCQQVSSIQAEAAQQNGCDVQAVTSRLLSERCSNYNGGNQPPNSNPNLPGNPGFPGNPGYPGNPGSPFPGSGSSRFISCNVISNGSYPTLMSLLAGPGSHSFSYVTLNERRKGLLGAIGISRKLGEVRVTYQPPQGTIPETLTATIKYHDRATDRDVLAKHSGFAGAPLVLDAAINGAQITVSCNQGLTANSHELNDSANLVCAGTSHVLGSHIEEPIQWIKPINSFVDGEEARVSDAVSVSLDKKTSILTVHTNVDSVLGPNMTSSSSLRSNLLVEANEGIGKAKITCSVK